MSDDGVTPPDDRPRRWAGPVGWLTLLAAGWALYELTHSPALASVLICCKFGWEDVRAAGWLARRDPQRWRRWACLALYLSWGVWKTAAVALLMGVGFGLVAQKNAALAVNGAAVLAWAGVLLTFFGGMVLSGALTTVAIACAWAGGVRLWLDRGVHRARRHDFWPPTPFCFDHTNRLPMLLVPGILLMIVVAVSLLFVFAWRELALGGFVLAVFSPVVVLVGREFVIHRVGAETPEECWPEEWDPKLPWRQDPPLQ